MDFASLMNKAKANTDQQRNVAVAKLAGQEVARKAEAQRVLKAEREEAERKKRETAVRQRREQEQKDLEERLQRERERKKLEKAKQPEVSTSLARAPVAKAAVSSTATRPIPTARPDRKKRKKMDDLFSDDDDYGSDASGRRVAKGKGKAANGMSSTTATLRKKAAAGMSLSAKDRLRAEFDPNAAIKLNTNKRDLRTIEEIEMDNKRRRESEAHGDVAPAISSGIFSLRKGQNIASAPLARSAATASNGQAASNVASAKEGFAGMSERFAAKRLRHSESPPTTKSEKKSSKLARDQQKGNRGASYSPPPRPGASKSDNKGKDKSKGDREGGMRQEIWKILNPHKTFTQYADYDSDDIDKSDNDMEAGYNEMEEEDRRAESFAKREDREELARLERRAKEKEAAKRQKLAVTAKGEQRSRLGK